MIIFGWVVRVMGVQLTPREMLEVACQILHGLTAIHNAGIMHLDIKPGNIVFTDKTLVQIKIIDFGLVRRTPGPQDSVPTPRVGTRK